MGNGIGYSISDYAVPKTLSLDGFPSSSELLDRQLTDVFKRVAAANPDAKVIFWSERYEPDTDSMFIDFSVMT